MNCAVTRGRTDWTSSTYLHQSVSSESVLKVFLLKVFLLKVFSSIDTEWQLIITLNLKTKQQVLFRNSHPAVCGVSSIWTLASYRGLKIVTRLLDAIRCYLIASNLIVQYAFIYCDFVSRRSDFIYGKIIAVEEVAFSDPTDNGLSFAQSYTKRPDFIVYNM